MTPFECYQAWLAVSKHFKTWGYDYFKYNGKLKNVKPESFQTHRNRWLYEKLSRHPDPLGVIVAYAARGKNWIGDAVKDSDGLYTERQKRLESLTYVYKNEIASLDPQFNDNFNAANLGRHPSLVVSFLAGEVSDETLAILCDLSGCVPHWKDNGDDIVQGVAKIAHKMLPFVEYDRDKFRLLTVDFFTNKE